MCFADGRHARRRAARRAENDERDVGRGVGQDIRRVGHGDSGRVDVDMVGADKKLAIIRMDCGNRSMAPASSLSVTVTVRKHVLGAGRDQELGSFQTCRLYCIRRCSQFSTAGRSDRQVMGGFSEPCCTIFGHPPPKTARTFLVYLMAWNSQSHGGGAKKGLEYVARQMGHGRDRTSGSAPGACDRGGGQRGSGATCVKSDVQAGRSLGRHRGL